MEESAAIRVEASSGALDRLTLLLPETEARCLTWSLGQIANLRQLPVPLAGINLDETCGLSHPGGAFSGVEKGIGEILITDRPQEPVDGERAD